METLTLIFWVIAIIAVIGFIAWYLKSKGKERGKGEIPTAPAPEEKREETPGGPPSAGPSGPGV